MPLHPVPNRAQASYRPQKAPQSQSLSHTQFPNHFGQGDIQEQFEPTFVKLDKQVRIRSNPQRSSALVHLLSISAQISSIGYTSSGVMFREWDVEEGTRCRPVLCVANFLIYLL